jgi:hypothetical protein
MRGNDEVRMTKPEGMTKSQNLCNHFDEEFWNDGSGSVVREEPGENGFTILRSERRGLAKPSLILQRQFHKTQ